MVFLHSSSLLLLLSPLLLLLLFLLLLLPPPAAPQQDYTIPEVEGEEVEHVKVVLGLNASLPCDVRAPHHDQPTLTLWYIADEEAPVYSYDERPGVRGSQWSDLSVLGRRATYHPHHTPPALHLSHITLQDARLYRCRVDFKNTRSRVTWVNLTVIVPPSRAEVLSRVSPIPLGEKNDVICKAYGGSPPPEVLWLQGNVIVDSSYTVSGPEVYNVLEAPAERLDLTSPFTCRASNNDLVGPVELTYLRNVTCGPLSVKIQREEEPVREGRPARLSCTVVGSNPPPEVTWYRHGQPAASHVIRVTNSENVTKSELTLNATRADHLVRVVCKAVNKLLEIPPVEDVYILDVQYKPEVRLSLGRSLDAENLQEFKDIFLECHIDANPMPYKVEWRHDGRLVSHNASQGVIVSESTLALQKVRREASGKYQCSASNVEGDAISDPVPISIKYAPRCTVSPVLRGVAMREALNVTCRVEADPPDVSFTWTFNNSVRRDHNKVFGEARYSKGQLESVLEYIPSSERDYGTLLCYARNSVGRMATPCSFTVISAGPPEGVRGCGVDNITSHSVTVACYPGFNGGLPQLFTLEVWTHETAPILVLNVTRASPVFLVRSLAPGHQYRAQVTAHNPRGGATPVGVSILTLKEAEMHKSLPSRSEPSAVMLVCAVLGGALLVVLLLLLVGVMGVRGCRRGRGRGGRREEDEEDEEEEEEEEEVTRVGIKESNPDLLDTSPAIPLTLPSPPPPAATNPISISIIKPPPPPPPPVFPNPFPPSFTAPTTPSTPLGGLGGLGGAGMEDRRGGTLPSSKSGVLVVEPLHRPIAESLQRSLRGLSSQHLT
ncbi:hemicentin-1-like [Eriocheir sinensis]|uniref:hemicentin-1-like n=1 Tax=Eriocheir sinensis TaxID=95602 RepID=UPI0021C97C54|nr:hemicentin-1-like [Eriocheir sinensis]